MTLKYKVLCAVIFFISNVAGLTAQQILFIDQQQYSCASSFNIAVRTKNISNVVALQGTVRWDTSIVKFNNISFGVAAITFNATNVNSSAAANGYLTFLWIENNLQRQTVPDNSNLFTVNFITNGKGKGKGAIVFSNTPTAMEIDTLSNGFPSVNSTAVFSDGYIITPFIYNFIGSGNWDADANWKDNIPPPIVLPECSEIIVNPSGTGECVLNVPQTISPGAKMTVIAGKKLKISGSLTLQ